VLDFLNRGALTKPAMIDKSFVKLIEWRKGLPAQIISAINCLSVGLIWLLPLIDWAKSLQSVEKLRFQAVQKGLRYEAHEKSTSGGVLNGYVKAR